MACENCKYWQYVFAPYIKKLIKACTCEEEKGPGGCTFFERKDEPQAADPVEIFRYKEGSR